MRCTMVFAEVDHAKTNDKICVLAPALFETTSAHTVVLKVMAMNCKVEWWAIAERNEWCVQALLPFCEYRVCSG